MRGGWGNLKAGHSGRIVGADDPGGHEMLNVPMDFDGCATLGSGLGTAAVIVMDKSTDLDPRRRASALFLQA